MIAGLDALLAPVDTSIFFAEYYEKKHLHVRAADDARANLLAHEELWQALASVPTIPEGLVCFPEQLGTTREALLSNGSILRKYLDAGHPLVWNRARGLSPRIDAVSAILAQAFGGHVWPNVYATGTAGTPFDMHFDAHEVIAVHCAGEKTWELSRVRVDRPIEAVEMEPAIKYTLQARVEEATNNVVDTFTVCPGDLVYIPRGQFHNARTVNGRSLHVTFGIELPTAFDLAKRIVMDLLADPTMREYPLPRTMDPDGENARRWSAALSLRLMRSISPEGLGEVRNELERAWVKKSGI